ncbi:MAG: cyclase family protein, partial [Acidimicrobiales bacterium]
MNDPLLDAVASGVRVFDLGRPMFVGMPQSANHPPFWHTLPRRHGDMVRPDGGSAANDLIVTGTHVGTHIDALAHVSQDGLLHGGVDAAAASLGGKFMDLGVHTVPPLLARGVLLDVPVVLGAACCDPGYEITPDDLESAAKAIGHEVTRGDVVLVRSGWGARYHEGAVAYAGAETGVPGVGEAGARW